MTTLNGTSPLSLTTDAAGNFTFTYGDTSPPPPPSGGLVPRSAAAIYTVNENLSATIPIDNTIPQNNEGTEVVNVTMAAQTATSKVRVQFDAYGGHVTSDNALIGALFIDSEASARRAVAVNPPGPAYTALMRLVYEWVPGDTNPHVYRIRVGSSLGAMRLNGWGSGPKLGATSAAVLTVDEHL